jgi:PAS domain S-box-containing protein
MAGPISVLHVDDAPDFAELAATRLEAEGDRITVETATRADAALDRIADGDVDCVVSDYDMPGRNGLELLRAVRERHPGLPFILFTGKGSEEVASEAVSAGVTDYLQKTTGTGQYAVLANRIENAVDQYRSRQALADSERRLSLFIDQSPLGVIEWDENFDVVQCNAAAEEILGFEENELVGESWEALVPDSDRGQVGDGVEELLAAEGGYHSVNENRRADGERVTCEWHNRVITDEAGDTVAIFSQFQEVTEREAQKRELRRKERRYEAVFDDPNILVGLIATDGTVLDINETAMGYVDADLEEVIGEPFWTTPWFDHDETTRAEVREWVERAANGEYVESEVDLVDPAGEPYTIEGVIRPVTDADGEVVSLLISDRDVSERKERERRLREEQQFVKSIFDALPDLLYAFDADGYPLRWNDELEAVTGYDAAEIADMYFTEFVPDDEATEIAERFQTVLAEREAHIVESAVETKEGESIPYELAGAPLEDADGTLRGVTGVGRNIADRTERERQLRTLNETAQELIAAETREEVAERGVEAARDVLGLKANAIHLYEDEELVPVAQTERTKELIGDAPTFTPGDSIAWRVFESGEPLALDDVPSDPDTYNEETAVKSELYVPIGDEGILIAGSPTEETFDQRHLVLGEILAGNVASALEQVARTAQLRERERELTRRNERLEEFTSVVSHDLRNPLQVAEGRLALLREEADNEHLAEIAGAFDRMDVLIEDLLTLAREGEDASSPEAVDLGALASACWRNVATGDAAIEVDADREIRADPSRLQQLFENLMRNAIDHAGPDVTVVVGTTDDGFYVADDGPGIPDGDRKGVFQSGYSTAEDGAGFGLAIVHQVAEAHGWTVRVTEGPAGGARFEFGDVAAADA